MYERGEIRNIVSEKKKLRTSVNRRARGVGQRLRMGNGVRQDVIGAGRAAGGRRAAL